VRNTFCLNRKLLEGLAQRTGRSRAPEALRDKGKPVERR
jgi:hypothetical protein